MATAPLRLLQIAPGSRELSTIIEAFCRKPGLISAFADERLTPLRRLVPEDSDVEVIPWGSLTQRYLSSIGEPTGQLASRGQIAASIAMGCEELPDDSPLAKSARFPGTHAKIASCLSELRRYGIDAQELVRLSQELAPPSSLFERTEAETENLKLKLRDLAFLEKFAADLLHKSLRERAEDRIFQSLDLRGVEPSYIRRLLFVAGYEQRPYLCSWVRWLAEQGVEVSVLIERLPGKNFISAARTVEQLGLPLPDSPADLPWTSVLFTSDIAGPEKPQVEILSAPDSLSECEWAVRGALKAMSEGVPPNRIGIFVRRPADYGPLLSAASERLGLPAKIQISIPLLTNSLAVLVLAILRALSGNDVRKLNAIAASSYLSVSSEGRLVFADTVKQAYSKRSSQWAWLKENMPVGDEFAWAAHLCEWRDSSLRDSVRLYGWCDRLRDLIGGMRFPEFLAADQSPTRERDLRAQNALQRAIADYAGAFDLLRARNVDLFEFVKIAESLWAREDTVLPSLGEGVTVFSNTVALHTLDVLFVLEMLEGAIPRRRTEDPILADSEKQKINALRPGLPALPDSFEIAAEERSEFIRICSAATTKLVFSYPKTDDDRDSVPTFYLDELQRAHGNVKTYDYRKSEVTPGAEHCLAAADARLSEALAADQSLMSAPELHSPLAQSAIKADPQAGITPREIIDALQCPFAAASRHRLSLRRRSASNAWNRLIRIPVAAGLAGQQDEEEALKALSLALEAEMDLLWADLDEWEIGLLRSGGKRLIASWIRKEFAARRLWPRDHVKISPALGREELVSCVSLGAQPVTLVEAVPAVSWMDKYSLIHVYRNFEPKLCEGQFGEDDYDMVYFGALLWVQARRSPAQAIEIDLMAGGRILLTLPGRDHQRTPEHTKFQFKNFILDLSPENFFRSVKQGLRKGLEILAEAKMEATPKERVCETCDYVSFAAFLQNSANARIATRFRRLARRTILGANCRTTCRDPF